MKYFEKSALEAVLFVSGDPLPLVKLSEAVGQNLEETERLLLELQTALEENQRGIRLAEVHGGWQLPYQGCLETQGRRRIARQPR